MGYKGGWGGGDWSGGGGGEWSGGEVGVAAVDDGVTVGARGKGKG